MPATPPNRPGCPRPRGTRPLPDPAAVRMCLIPDPAPPYDGETPPAHEDGRPASGDPGQGRWGEEERPPAPARKTGAAAAAAAPEPEPGAGHGAQRTARLSGRVPSADGGAGNPAWPSRFAQVLAETLAGSRPARQMTSWTTERARDSIQRLGARLSSGQQPRVRRVVTSCPAAGVMEMTVVVGFGPRVRALAVRLEEAGPAGGHPAGAPRWLCTAVEAA
jgi:uncharacterized protein DUF6459